MAVLAAAVAEAGDNRGLTRIRALINADRLCHSEDSLP